MIILETERLVLRTVSLDDAEFILTLVNTPAWLEFIGDHEVYDLDDAADYIIDGPQTMFREYGFALSLVELKANGEPIGVCGLVKRDILPDPDLGFAFLPEFCGRGFGHEAAAAVLIYGQEQLGIRRVLALSLPENRRSIGLLERLGFEFIKRFRVSDEEPEANLFVRYV